MPAVVHTYSPPEVHFTRREIYFGAIAGLGGLRNFDNSGAVRFSGEILRDTGPCGCEIFR